MIILRVNGGWQRDSRTEGKKDISSEFRPSNTYKQLYHTSKTEFIRIEATGQKENFLTQKSIVIKNHQHLDLWAFRNQATA